MELSPDVLAVPVFVLFIYLEARWRLRSGRSPLPLGQARASALTGLGQVGVRGLELAAIGGLFALAWEHRLATVPTSSAGWWLLYFAVVELVHYWSHRLSHEVRWLWASHAVHHTSEDLNLSAALRNGWTDFVSGLWLPWLGLTLLGFSPVATALLGGVMRVYGFFLHTEAGPRIARLGWVLNTPSHHRVHHAVNPDYIDRNYGGALIVFDRIFGTFAREHAAVAPRYGVVPAMRSANPLALVVHEWRRLFHDVRRSTSFRSLVQALFGRSGGASEPSVAEAPTSLREAT